jgi:hypothetical protein
MNNESYIRIILSNLAALLARAEVLVFFLIQRYATLLRICEKMLHDVHEIYICITHGFMHDAMMKRRRAMPHRMVLNR